MKGGYQDFDQSRVEDSPASMEFDYAYELPQDTGLPTALKMAG